MAALNGILKTQKADAFNHGLGFNTQHPDAFFLASFLLRTTLILFSLWFRSRGRYYVGMVNEVYDCTIRMQPLDKRLVLFD